MNTPNDEEPPLVSVVIPSFNCEDYLSECIHSVLMQDYPNIELIVVDDASHDNSVGIATAIAEDHSGSVIKIVAGKVNVGECLTSTVGYSLASGKYICRLSCDDAYIRTEHISRQVEAMEKYHLDWCYNSLNRVGETVVNSKYLQTSFVPCPIQSLANFFHHFDNFLLNFHNYCYLVAIVRNPVNFNAAMVRADKYRAHLTFVSEIHTICDAWIESRIYLSKFRGMAIPTVGALWRISDYQQTGKPETTRAYLKMRKQLYNRIRDGNHPSWMKFCASVLRRKDGI